MPGRWFAKPISENYLFTNAGLYLLIGSIGSGKSYFISRHILYTDQLVNETTGEKGFYRSVIIITSGNKSDETTESFLKGVKNTIIVRVSETEAIPFLSELFRVKRKYYALYKAFMSNLKDLDDEAERIFQKHSFPRYLKVISKMKTSDRRNPLTYMVKKFVDYEAFFYPIRTLIVIDDAAGSYLIQKRNSDLIKMIKTSRHLHSSFVISVQTIADSMKDLKRIACDIIIWKNVSQSDIEKVLSDIPLPVIPGVSDTKKYIIDLHSKLESKRSKIVINIVNNNVSVEN